MEMSPQVDEDQGLDLMRSATQRLRDGWPDRRDRRTIEKFLCLVGVVREGSSLFTNTYDDCQRTASHLLVSDVETKRSCRSINPILKASNLMTFECANTGRRDELDN